MDLKNKHNKKSDFVGNHGGAYTDNDGHRKQFTYVDHDVKTKISVPSKRFVQEYKEPEDPFKDLRNKHFILVSSDEELPSNVGEYFTNMGKLTFDGKDFNDHRCKYGNVLWFKKIENE